MNAVLSGSDEISYPRQSFTTFLLLFYPTQALCCLGSISRLYPISWEVHNLVEPGVTPCAQNVLKQRMPKVQTPR